MGNLTKKTQSVGCKTHLWENMKINILKNILLHYENSII